jgi:hypothetical protein
MATAGAALPAHAVRVSALAALLVTACSGAPAASAPPALPVAQSGAVRSEISAPVAVLAASAQEAAPALAQEPAHGLLAEEDVADPALPIQTTPEAAQGAPQVPAQAQAPAPASAQADATPTARPPIRIPKPAVPPGPRRIGLQVGHWKTDEVPDELRRIENQTGTSGGGVYEWQLNLDVANRVAALLRGHGYAVDIIPTTVPPGYLADVFVALHADGDPSGASRGYKAAHGSRRGPYEDQLVRVLLEEYGNATGLPHDHDGVTRNMLGYYAFSWSRFQHSVAAHTPAAIFEMGFMTNGADRAVLLQRTEQVATGLANGILRFLHEVPAGAAFAEDLIVPAQQPRTQPGQPAPPAPAAPARAFG